MREEHLMSEPDVLAANGVAGPVGAAQSVEDSAVQAGQLLRHAREAAGVHLEALAVTLKVQVHTVESLEAGRLNELLDVVFARGLASSICRVLKVDAAPVLALLPRKASAAMAVTPPAVQATFRPADVGGSSGPSALRRLLSSPAGLIVLLLVIGAAALWLVPQLQGDDPEVSATASEPVSASTIEVTPAAAASAAAEAPAAISVPALQPPPSVAAAASAAAAVAVAPSAAASKAAAATVTGAPTGGEFLTISAKAPSWIRVTDATGVVVINRTLQAGETAQAGGTAPLAVVVGAADAVQVQVRGQAFDLAPIARTNVARFEVK
jgi:cytoskeleton protein RodZ